jgi:hypothetical protein
MTNRTFQSPHKPIRIRIRYLQRHARGGGTADHRVGKRHETISGRGIGIYPDKVSALLAVADGGSHGLGDGDVGAGVATGGGHGGRAGRSGGGGSGDTGDDG